MLTTSPSVDAPVGLFLYRFWIWTRFNKSRNGKDVNIRWRPVSDDQMNLHDEIIITLVDLGQYFGLRKGEIMSENPLRHSLKIFPNEKFAHKMLRLEKLQNVRVPNLLAHHLFTLITRNLCTFWPMRTIHLIQIHILERIERILWCSWRDETRILTTRRKDDAIKTGKQGHSHHNGSRNQRY